MLGPQVPGWLDAQRVRGTLSEPIPAERANISPVMPTAPSFPEAVIEVIEPDGSRRTEKISSVPYLIGRGAEEGNHLQFADKRVSRKSAAITFRDGAFHLVDRGQRQGLTVNGEKFDNDWQLREGDQITLGAADTLQLVFHLGEVHDSLPELLSRMEGLSTLEPGARDLRQLSLLLEATALLQSGLPIEDLLGAMVDRAVSITDADRGLLLEQTADEKLTPMVARQKGSLSLAHSALSPSYTVIRHATELGHGVVQPDLAQAEAQFREGASVVAQGLRMVVAIPLFSLGQLRTDESTSMAAQRSLLGVLYLDSRRTAAFSNLQRQILDALALEAASVLDNARLLRRERERRRFEQELAIARQIQQALLPRAFDFPNLRVTGINRSCLDVGGDYFDLMAHGDRSAFVIADVCGKGLGAALLTAMLQGAFASLSLGLEIAPFFSHINNFMLSHSGVQRYATLFFGVIDRSGLMEFINAGHVPPILVRDGKVQQGMCEASFPVGLLPMAEYTTCTAQLEPGDTIVLVTDGITEAMNPEHDEYGRERLIQGVEKCAGLSVEQMQAWILANVELFTRGEYQSDDLTLLIVRYAPAL